MEYSHSNEINKAEWHTVYHKCDVGQKQPDKKTELRYKSIKTDRTSL